MAEWSNPYFKPAEDPEAFKAKLQAMREGTGLSVSYSYGGGDRQTFHNAPSVRERERRQVERMQKAGIQFDRP